MTTEERCPRAGGVAGVEPGKAQQVVVDEARALAGGRGRQVGSLHRYLDLLALGVQDLEVSSAVESAETTRRAKRRGD